RDLLSQRPDLLRCGDQAARGRAPARDAASRRTALRGTFRELRRCAQRIPRRGQDRLSPRRVHGEPAMSYQHRERIARLQARAGGEGEARTFFNDHTFGRVMVKVLPGEYYVTDEDMIVSTVLGSCVAVCLAD